VENEFERKKGGKTVNAVHDSEGDGGAAQGGVGNARWWENSLAESKSWRSVFGRPSSGARNPRGVIKRDNRGGQGKDQAHLMGERGKAKVSPEWGLLQEEGLMKGKRL